MLVSNNLPRGGSSAGGGGHGSASWKDTKSFTLQVLSGRWFMLFASLLIMSFSGSTYLFGLYSDELKSSLGYDQTTLNLLSFFRDSGTNVGLISGVINEFFPPWVVISLAAATNFFGYFMMWLAVTGRIPKPHFWHMCLYMAVASNAQTFTATGTIVTAARNFPASKSPVLGLLLGYTGLGGAITSQLYHALFGHDAKSLILLLAFLLTLVSIVFLPSVRYMEVEVLPRSNEVKVCNKILYISLGLAGFLMGIILIQSKINLTRVEYIPNAFLILVLLLLPLLVVIQEEFNLKNQAFNKPSHRVRVEISPPEVQHNAELLAVEEVVTPSLIVAEYVRDPRRWVSRIMYMIKPPPRGEDYTTLQAIFSFDMMLLFTAISCGLGGTLGAIGNLGQISDSLSYSTSKTATFVSMVSIWNYLGRVVAGFGSEYLLKHYKLPRSLVLSLFLLLSCVGHLLIAFAIPNSLCLASVIMGFCLGGQWPLMYAIISDLFGLKYYSTLVNFATVACPVGSYVLNVKAIGFLYDKEALKQMGAGGDVWQRGQNLTCRGKECYKMSFIIVTMVTLVGFLASFWLVVRTRKFYRDCGRQMEGNVEKEEIGPGGN